MPCSAARLHAVIIGHVGAAFAAKRLWPRVSLALLLICTFLPDLLRIAFIPFGMWSSDSNVYTHTDPWCVLLAAAAAAGAWAWTRQRGAAAAAFALVLAHVLFDLVSGRKVLWDNGPRGWNLDAEYWQYELLIEVGLVVLGWILMRPVVGAKWSRRRVVVGLALFEFAFLALGVSDRPWRRRCWAYPFKQCDDSSSLLTRKWPFRPFFGLKDLI
jgi:hypothetical protein